MTAERWPAAWQGRLVGWLENPSFDFPHDYGRWIPDGPAGDEFITALRRAVDDDDGLEVTVCETRKRVAYGLPGETGQIDFRWLAEQGPERKWWQLWKAAP